MNVFPIIFYSSVGSILGNDNIEISTFESPKINKSAPIFLFDQKTHMPISVFSKFNSNKILLENINVKDGPFFAVSHDPEKKYNGVIADNIGGENVVD